MVDFHLEFITTRAYVAIQVVLTATQEHVVQVAVEGKPGRKAGIISYLC